MDGVADVKISFSRDSYLCSFSRNMLNVFKFDRISIKSWTDEMRR